MARLAFSTNSHREFLDDPHAAVIDSTRVVYTSLTNTCGAINAKVNGGPVATAAGLKNYVVMIAPK